MIPLTSKWCCPVFPLKQKPCFNAIVRTESKQFATKEVTLTAQDLHKRTDDDGRMSTFDFLRNKYGSATISCGQLAGEFGSHPTRVRRLCADGTIHAVKISARKWVIPLAAAAAFLDGEAK